MNSRFFLNKENLGFSASFTDKGVYRQEVDHETITIAAVLKLANYLNHKMISGGENRFSVECQLMYKNAIDELMIDPKILNTGGFQGSCRLKV